MPGFRVWGLGFRVWGGGGKCLVQDTFRVSGLGPRVTARSLEWKLYHLLLFGIAVLEC